MVWLDTVDIPVSEPDDRYAQCRACHNVFEAPGEGPLPPCPLCHGVLAMTPALPLRAGAHADF
jgi:hypothetical protein